MKATATSPSPRTARDGAIRPLHILVVEDEPDVRESLSALLKTHGHRVELAEDGAIGVDKAIALQPDIALVDIALPNMDGFEAARRIRAALGNRITLIACTAFSGPEDHQTALDAGFDALRVKPYDPHQLLTWLQILRPEE